MIFKLCETVIKNTINRKEATDTFVENMIKKVDVFLLNNRITIDEYEKLKTMLSNLNKEDL